MSMVASRAARGVWLHTWHERGGHPAGEPPSDPRPLRYAWMAMTAGPTKIAVMTEKMIVPISPPSVEGCWVASSAQTWVYPGAANLAGTGSGGSDRQVLSVTGRFT